MPYYIVPADTCDLPSYVFAPGVEFWRVPVGSDTERAPIIGECPTRAAAAKVVRALPAGSAKTKIVFVPTEAEHYDWQERERRRLRDGEYIAAPWTSAGWYVYNDRMSLHYAHISTRFPELVAYTPSAEYGIADRQIRTTPGRYLDQFVKTEITSAVRDRYIAQVKAFDGRYKVAASPIEVVAVYRCGPDSCMSHEIDHYDPSCDGHHPVEVYGDSDLAVAYLGTIDGPGSVTSRTLIWRDKKRYGRVYGQGTGPALVAALQRDGFVCAYDQNDDDPSFAGARIRAIDVGNDRLLLPYVDGCLSADRRGSWLTLRIDESGEYGTQRVEGVSRPPSQQCETCSNYIDEDNGPFCGDCRWSCTRCETDFGGDDSAHEVGGRQYCENCLESLPTCDVCSEAYDRARMGSSTHRTRQSRNMDECCNGCARDHEYCTVHEHYYDSGDACGECEVDRDTSDDSDTDDTDAPAVDAPQPAPDALSEALRLAPFMDVPSVSDGGRPGLLQDALSGGRWIRPAVARTCSICSCARPIAAGALAFQGDCNAPHLTYCVDCMIGFAVLYPSSTARVPNVAPLVTRTLNTAAPCDHATCRQCYTFTVPAPVAPEREVSR